MYFVMRRHFIIYICINARLILPLLLLLYFTPVKGQNVYPILNEIINSDLNIRQIPNTENVLKDFLFDDINDNDTVYGIIYTPMDCPRCEVKVRNFPLLLKSLNPDANIVLITVYPDSTAAKSYNATEGYDKLYDRIIYDNEEKHADIFSYSIGELNIVYFIKANSKGELIVGGDPLYINKEFINEINNYSARIETFNYKNQSSHENIPNIKYNNFLEKSGQFKILSDWTISETIYTPLYFNGYLLFNDKLDNSILSFTKEKDVFISHMKFMSDSLENDIFVDLPPNIYKACKRNGNFFYLANAPTFLSDSILGISYSLPKAYMESSDMNNAVAFYNAPVCIRRNFYTGEKLPLVHFEEREYKYFNHHFNIVGNNNIYIMGTQKGTWPIWEMDPEKINTADDPFSEKFYSDTTYYMVMFDSIGNQKALFGNYNNIIRNTLTGTILVHPLSYIDGEYLYYSDGITGEIIKSSISNPDSIIDTISIFKIITVR